jgi:hypothetical protein
MSRLQLSLAVATVLVLLLGWQWWREARMSACHADGGVWHGWTSRCQPKPGAPILRRDIERTHPSQQLLRQAA